MTTTRKPADILPRLTEWEAVHTKVMAQYEALRAITGLEPESPLACALWDTFDAYTRAVSELVGDDDEWLDWYRLECKMGADPKFVESLTHKLRVKTLRDLARVICNV